MNLSESRNSSVTPVYRRRCSFCRTIGHNIQTCSDERLSEFERECVTKYIAINYRDGLFEAWLKEYYEREPNIVRAYAVRYCGSTIRTFVISIILSIKIRISNLVYSSDSEYNERTRLELHDASRELLNLVHSDANTPQHPMTTQEVLALFISMVNTFSERTMLVRKFKIETRICENHDTMCEDNECNICYELCSKPNFIKLNCGHEFCRCCIKSTFQNSGRRAPVCAFCRSEITSIEISDESIKRDLDEFIYSE